MKKLIIPILCVAAGIVIGYFLTKETQIEKIVIDQVDSLKKENDSLKLKADSIEVLVDTLKKK